MDVYLCYVYMQYAVNVYEDLSSVYKNNETFCGQMVPKIAPCFAMTFRISKACISV